MTPFEMVKEFHETYGMPVGEQPQLITDKRHHLRCSLIEEEYTEYVDAVGIGNIGEIADALGDLIYVVYGAALEHGINLDPVITEIHRSNMSKLQDGKPVYREDGKVLKGPNYFPPNIEKVLDEQSAHL